VNASSTPAAILITGGSGFIGRAVIAELEKNDAFGEIVNVDLEPGPGQYLPGDIRQPLPIDDLDGYDFAACVHLAGLSKEPGYDHDEYFDTNLRGTRHVLETCRLLSIPQVIFTSTMMVHAPSDDRKIESDVLNPNTAYGTSKALAEGEMLEFAKSTGAKVSILRPGVVFGPGDIGNFPRLLRMLERKIFFYVGRQDTVKSCVHVDDAVGVISHLLADPQDSDVYNVALNAPTTISEIVGAIQSHFGCRYRVPTVPFRLAHVASRPFEALAAVGLETGIHHRRIEKLFESTNISADRLSKTGYEMCYPTIDEAIGAWADEERTRSES